MFSSLQDIFLHIMRITEVRVVFQSSEKKHWRKGDTVLKKLVEAEMDAAAAAKQVAALHSTISKLGSVSITFFKS